MQKIAENLFHIKEDVIKIVAEINKNNLNNYSYVNALNNIIEVIFEKDAIIFGNNYEYLRDSDIEFITEVFSNKCLNLKEQNNYIKNFDIKDETVRHVLISQSMWLVTIIALNYINNGIEYMDLVQEGSIGIINAINNYKNKNNKAYSTLVKDEIIAIIEKNVCTKGKYGHITDKTFNIYKNLDNVKDKIFMTYGCEGNYEEICEHFNYPSDSMKELMILSQDSLDLDSFEFILDNGKSSESIIDVEEIAVNNIYYKDLLETCNLILNKKERFVIYQFFGLNNYQRKTQAEIALLIGCSRSRVGQIIDISLMKIRKKIINIRQKAKRKSLGLITIDDIKK